MEQLKVEPPECPVCLTPYDAVSTIPRVLPCGHSTCEACLTHLPNPFPNTIRCPSCTHLVKFPNSPSSFPKNFDLLHISSLLQPQQTPIPKKDFSHVYSFKGHEHKVMAVVFVDEEEPLCISGDNGGVICIWSARVPFGPEPIRKMFEQKDWRYSGIHALAASGTEYLYTGSGDKTIKAWSLQDYTIVCAMSGHKSVVSSLAVSNGVLYSGSWDGTVRLWSLGDHSPLAVLEVTLGSVSSVTSLAADSNVLVVTHEDGCLKIWHNDTLLKSEQAHDGAIFAVIKKGKWLFAGGWDKTLTMQELSGDGAQLEVAPVGSIPSGSTITALAYWQGKLFAGQADRLIKVYYSIF